MLDLTLASSFANGHPWAEYARLREHDPVAWHPEANGPGFWVLSKYDDIRLVSRQPQRFSSERGGVFIETPDQATLAVQAQMMLNMDPPRHDRFKLLVSRGFTPRAAQDLTDRVARLADQVLDELGDRDRVDFVTDIAGRLPSGLIAELMGIPRSDGERLYELTEIMHTTDDAVAPVEARMAAVGEMLSYAHGVVQAKRAAPGDDIASVLAHAEVDGVRLTEAELQWFFLLLVNAGGDTTRNLVAAGMQLLFEHPAQWARLCSDTSLLPTAVEEMLRFTTPVIYFRRTATEAATIRGVEIAAGDKVILLYGSANRDADVFADPDRFDVGRSPNPHLAFGGGGPHLCLGMHVARIEIEAIFRGLIERFPAIRSDGERELMASNFIAGVHAMPVSLGSNGSAGARRSSTTG